MSEGIVVVLGASTDRNKYGNKSVRAYLKRGWTVYPVNPKADEIEGVKAFKSLKEITGPIDRVTVYLPPTVVITLLDDIASLHPQETYFNPGSESVEVMEKAAALGLNPIAACSIVDIGMTPSQFPGQ
jgi:predicted CoA-binding protein